MADQKDLYERIVFGRPAVGDDYEDQESLRFYCDACEISWIGKDVTSSELLCPNCGDAGYLDD